MNSGSNSQMTPSCKLPIKFDFLRPPYIEKKKKKKKKLHGFRKQMGIRRFYMKLKSS